MTNVVCFTYRTYSAYPIFGLFGFFFQPEQYFSLTIIQPEQCFSAKFQTNEWGYGQVLFGPTSCPFLPLYTFCILTIISLQSLIARSRGKSWFLHQQKETWDCLVEKERLRGDVRCTAPAAVLVHGADAVPPRRKPQDAVGADGAASGLGLPPHRAPIVGRPGHLHVHARRQHRDHARQHAAP